MAVPSPEGVRIVFPVITFVLNALTLKYSAIKNPLDQGGFSQFTESCKIMSVVIAIINSFLAGYWNYAKTYEEGLLIENEMHTILEHEEEMY